MKTAIADDLEEILRPLAPDMERVTRRLVDSLQTPVAKLVEYLVTAGGKRLRPALVLLAGRSGDFDRHDEDLINLSTAVELTHTATLIHDDIIDRAAVRRKQPTFHERFGTERAVLMGDYLYASAFSTLAKIPQLYATTYMAEICQQMSRGEFQEVACRYRLDLKPGEYLDIIRDKTAALIAACCHLGAYLTGAAPDAVERITRFGWNYGMAFQVIDDCLDLIGEEQTVGKPLLSDLDKGSLSLPVIYLARAMGAKEREKFFAPLMRHAADRRFLARVAKEAKRTGAIDQSIATAETFIQEATSAIAPNNGVAGADTYHQLAEHAIRRVQ